MVTKLIAGAVLSVAVITSALAREWKDSTGKVLASGDPKRAEGDNVIIADPDLKDGFFGVPKETPVPFANLCKEDQAAIDRIGRETLAGQIEAVNKATAEEILQVRTKNQNVPDEGLLLLYGTSKLNESLKDWPCNFSFRIENVVPETARTARIFLTPVAGIPHGAMTRKELIVKLKPAEAANIKRGSSLVVQGKLEFEYGTCPFCKGTGAVKCPNCQKGKVPGPDKQVPMLSVRGQTFYKTVKTWGKCRTCDGAGRLDCKSCRSIGEWNLARTINPKTIDSVPFYLPSTANYGRFRCYVVLNDMAMWVETPGAARVDIVARK